MQKLVKTTEELKKYRHRRQPRLGYVNTLLLDWYNWCVKKQFVAIVEFVVIVRGDAELVVDDDGASWTRHWWS